MADIAQCHRFPQDVCLRVIRGSPFPRPSRISLSSQSGSVNGGDPPFGGRKFLLFGDAFSVQRVGCGKYYMLGLSIVTAECRCLATLFNIQISRLPDRSLMEIEENVNGGEEKGRFSQIPFGNRKNMQSQIVVCDSKDQKHCPVRPLHNTWAERQNEKGRTEVLTDQSSFFAR
jgi:hypothetical protein